MALPLSPVVGAATAAGSSEEKAQTAVELAGVVVGAAAAAVLAANPALTVRMQPDEREALNKLAAKWRMSRSATVRKLIRDADARTSKGQGKRKRKKASKRRLRRSGGDEM